MHPIYTFLSNSVNWHLHCMCFSLISQIITKFKQKITKIPFIVPHFLVSYLPWNTLQCLHWKCMPEWKAVNMSFLMTKVGLNVFFSINQSVSHHNIYGSTAICVSVVQCNKPTQRHLRPTCRCPTCDDDCACGVDMWYWPPQKVFLFYIKVEYLQ